MRSTRWTAWAVLFVLSLPAVTTRIYASDEIQYFAFLRSMVLDRDLSFDNEYRHFDQSGIARSSGFRETFLVETTATGRRKTYATIGSALLWAPFYAVGHGAARLSAAFGFATPVDGYSWPYVAAACYASAFYGWMAALLGWHLARRFTDGATAAAIAIAVGTPLIFYSYLAPLFAHATSAFAVALLLTTWVHVRGRWSIRGAVLLGALGALAAMVREQDIVFAAIPACDYLRHAWRSRLPATVAAGARVTGAAAFGFTLTYWPQAWAYLTINGRLRPAGDVTRKMSWTSPHGLDVLLSPEHGFLFWTPLAVLAIAGLVALAARASTPKSATHGAPDDRRWQAACLLAGVGLTIYMAGSVESWTVAGAFGQRRFLSLTAVLIVGLAALLGAARDWPRPGRVVLSGLVLLAIWWNLGMAAAFGLHRMDRQRLNLAANARTVFLELPLEAPGLAWRYWTNRDSLFQLPRQP